MIADGFFTDPDRLTVTVKDGVVTLTGAPGSVILGRSIAGRVRHVEGVAGTLVPGLPAGTALAADLALRS